MIAHWPEAARVALTALCSVAIWAALMGALALERYILRKANVMTTTTTTTRGPTPEVRAREITIRVQVPLDDREAQLVRQAAEDAAISRIARVLEARRVLEALAARSKP